MARAVATNFYTPKELTFQDEPCVVTCFASFAVFLGVLCGLGFWTALGEIKILYRKGRKEEPQRTPRAVNFRRPLW